MDVTVVLFERAFMIDSIGSACIFFISLGMLFLLSCWVIARVIIEYVKPYKELVLASKRKKRRGKR